MGLLGVLAGCALLLLTIAREIERVARPTVAGPAATGADGATTRWRALAAPLWWGLALLTAVGVLPRLWELLT